LIENQYHIGMGITIISSMANLVVLKQRPRQLSITRDSVEGFFRT
jgi:hypothetical protein